MTARSVVTLVLLACSSGLPPPREITGINLGTREPEDEIAVAPDGSVAILYSEFGTSISLSYRMSQDAGQTFGAELEMTFPGQGLVTSDPAIAVDAQGNFYAAFLGVHETSSGPDYTRVYVAKAPAGTSSFAPAIEISTPNNTTVLFDHPKIFVTAGGKLLVGYAAYPSYTSQTSQGIVSTSNDGTSWTSTTVIDAPESANELWFCEGQASVYLSFLGATSTAAYAGLRKSTDGGGTWSTTSVQVSLATDNVAEADVGCVATGSDLCP